MEITARKKIEIKAKEKYILSITENGYGKRTSHYDYRVTNRGGKGIIGIINSSRNGNVASSFPVFEGDEILISGPGLKKPINENSDWFFFVGDMTALPAIACYLEQIPKSAKGFVVLEIISKDDRIKLVKPNIKNILLIREFLLTLSDYDN